MKRSNNIILVWLLLAFLLESCSLKREVIGEYKSSVFTSSCFIHLDADGTGYYTWWTDIQMFNKGTWSISNDTIFFVDQSLLHQENKKFVIANKDLMEVGAHGEIYHKMNYFQRRRIYRGR